MLETTPMRRHTLPNGMAVAYQSLAELLHFYEDIFEKQGYTRNGIQLRGDDCVFDVGANVGLFTLFAARHRPGCRIFAFEPAPAIYRILQENVADIRGQVTLFNCGLSDHQGFAELTFYPYSSGMSSFYPDVELERKTLRALIYNQLASGELQVDDLSSYEEELLEQRFRSEQCRCPLRTLSDVLHEYRIECVDLLKIDVEKSELDVLLGITEEDWPKIRQAAIEVHDISPRLQQIRRLLRSHHFTVVTEQDEHYRTSDRYNVYAIREAPDSTAKPIAGRPARRPPLTWRRQSWNSE